MLTPVKRHGFTFWIASPAPVKADLPDADKDITVPERYRTHHAGWQNSEGKRHNPIRFKEGRAPYKTRLADDGVPPANIPERIREIQEAVRIAFGISEGQFFSHSRNYQVSHTRFASMGLCRRFTDYNLSEIARTHGRPGNGCTQHACQRFNAFMETDPEFKAKVAPIWAQFAKDAAA